MHVNTCFDVSLVGDDCRFTHVGLTSRKECALEMNTWSSDEYTGITMHVSYDLSKQPSPDQQTSNQNTKSSEERQSEEEKR